KINFIVLFALLSVCFADLSAQTVARLTVEAEKMERNNVPVSANLDKISFLADSSLQFFEVTPSGQVPGAFRVDRGPHGRLIWWILQGKTPAGKKRVFELAQGKSAPSHMPEITTSLENGGLVIRSGDRPVLNYQYETVYPPKGVDTVFK